MPVIVKPLSVGQNIQFTMEDKSRLTASRLALIFEELGALQEAMPGLFIEANRRHVRIVDVCGDEYYLTNERYDVAAVVTALSLFGLVK